MWWSEQQNYCPGFRASGHHDHPPDRKNSYKAPSIKSKDLIIRDSGNNLRKRMYRCKIMSQVKCLELVCNEWIGWWSYLDSFSISMWVVSCVPGLDRKEWQYTLVDSDNHRKEPILTLLTSKTGSDRERKGKKKHMAYCRNAFSKTSY